MATARIHMGPSAYPPAFYCTFGHQVMQNPVMNLNCQHLFDAAVLANNKRCPVDDTVLDCIPFNELKELIKANVSLSPKKSNPASQGPTPLKPKIVLSAENVHGDDVHGFIQYNGGFVSGSKDGTIKGWGPDLQHRVVYSGNGGAIDYKYWVTALASHPNATPFFSGSRDGQVVAWSPKGKPYTPEPWVFPDSGQHKAKARNLHRVTCLAALPDEGSNTPFLAGTPQRIHKLVLDAEGGKIRMVGSTKVHDNDWVYCVDPVDSQFGDQRLVVVVGAALEIWDQKDESLAGRWKFFSRPVAEDRGEIGRSQQGQIQRPHISAIARGAANIAEIAYTCFENNRGFGAVRIVNIEKSVITFNAEEHIGRTWCIAYATPQIFATGADDHLIKLWDVRVGPKSILSSPPQSGRVSCLVSPRENHLVSASCPDDVKRGGEKASFTLWDILGGSQPAINDSDFPPLY